MKVAVTGGSGKVGKALLEHLAAKGHQVLNMDRKPAYDRPGKFVYTDLARREMVQPVLEQVEAVIHMGEIPNSRVGAFTAEEIYGRNATSTALVLQVAAELKLRRIIYVSTVQVYGCWDVGAIAPAVLPIDETHPLRPQNVYGLVKVANESYCRFVSEKIGASVAIFRLPWVMTETPTDEWFMWLEREAKLNDGMGTYIKDTDTAEALELALISDRKGCEAYNLAADEAMSCRPIAEAIKRDKPDYPQLPADWPKFKSPLLADKAKEHFGWQPKYSFMNAFREKFGRDPEPRRS